MVLSKNDVGGEIHLLCYEPIAFSLSELIIQLGYLDYPKRQDFRVTFKI